MQPLVKQAHSSPTTTFDNSNKSSLLFKVIREIADDHAHEGHDDHAGHSDHVDHGHHDEHGHDEHGHEEAESTFCSGSACLRNWKIGFQRYCLLKV